MEEIDCPTLPLICANCCQGDLNDKQEYKQECLEFLGKPIWLTCSGSYQQVQLKCCLVYKSSRGLWQAKNERDQFLLALTLSKDQESS